MRRMFRSAAYAAALVVGGFIGCELVGSPVAGSGTARTEERAAGEVAEVTHAGVGDLRVVQGDKPGLSVSADDNLLPYLESVFEGRKLTLRTKSGHTLAPKAPITYTLTTKAIEKVSVSGAGNVSSDGITGGALALHLSGAGKVTFKGLELRSLALSLSGAGTVTVAGTADALAATVSGAGDVHAEGLRAKAAEVTISGVGNATVAAADTLKARVSGAGNIRYRGSPAVDQNVSGVGSIQPLAR